MPNSIPSCDHWKYDAEPCMDPHPPVQIQTPRQNKLPNGLKKQHKFVFKDNHNLKKTFPFG